MQQISNNYKKHSLRIVLWRFSNRNRKPSLRRNRTEPKPQFSGGYVTVFVRFQKWPSPNTTVRNNNVITTHAGLLPPLFEVTVWSGVTLQLNYWPRWTRATLPAPIELTDWLLACQTSTITHHVITHYYVVSDCWSSDSSETCKQLKCLREIPSFIIVRNKSITKTQHKLRQ